MITYNTTVSRPRSGGLQILRSLARLVRHGPDRILHPLRRKIALARVRSQSGSRTVLIVCHGNICRSPYAAAVLRRATPSRAGEPTRVISAGFIAAGRPAPAEALIVGARHGVDLTGHRSTLLTPELVAAASLVVVMNAAQRREIRRRYGGTGRIVIALGDLDPQPIRTRGIVDPFNRPLLTFERSFARIDRCITVLAHALVRHHGRAPVRA